MIDTLLRRAGPVAPRLKIVVDDEGIHFHARKRAVIRIADVCSLAAVYLADLVEVARTGQVLKRRLPSWCDAKYHRRVYVTVRYPSMQIIADRAEDLCDPDIKLRIKELQRANASRRVLNSLSKIPQEKEND
jgi:hypothetical protein